MSPFEILKEKLGDDIFIEFGDDSLNNAFERAFKLVINLIKDEEILNALIADDIIVSRYRDTDVAKIEAAGYAHNRKILQVQRALTPGVNYYRAKQIPQSMGDFNAQNSASIFYENDKYKPVWYFDEEGGLQSLPSVISGSNLWNNSGTIITTDTATITWDADTGTATFDGAAPLGSWFNQAGINIVNGSSYRVSVTMSDRVSGKNILLLNSITDDQHGLGDVMEADGSYTKIITVDRSTNNFLANGPLFFSVSPLTDNNTYKISNISIYLVNSDLVVYNMTYPIFGDSTDINSNSNTHQLDTVTFRNATEDAIFYGIPLLARKLVYTQTALNLIVGYLSRFVHEEEDTELVTLLNAHKQELELERKEELEFIVTRFGNAPVQSQRGANE